MPTMQSSEGTKLSPESKYVGTEVQGMYRKGHKPNQHMESRLVWLHARNCVLQCEESVRGSSPNFKHSQNIVTAQIILVKIL